MVYALSVKPSFGGLGKLKMHSEVRQQIKMAFSTARVAILSRPKKR